MKKPTKICKICGKEYEYCMSLKPKASPFVWQDVACCPEHGSLYFARVLKARGENPEAYGFVDPDKKENVIKESEAVESVEVESQDIDLKKDEPKEDFVNHNSDYKSKKKHNR